MDPALPRPAGTLVANVMHFARLLRRTGIPVGPSDMLAAQQALALVDIGSRAEVRTALRAAMVHRHEHAEIFEQAFAMFWRDPEAARSAAAMPLLDAKVEPPRQRAPPGSRRLAEARAPPRQKRDHREQRDEIYAAY